MSTRPGGELATRPLHFIWMCDCSGSMGANGKIQALNSAIREALPHMKEVARENPNAQILVRAIRFSTGATWHVSQPTPVDSFQWVDLQADGVTDMGKGLSMVAEQLKIPPMTDRALPPVIVLVSDGMPTDDFNKGLRDLMAEAWGKKAVRMAVAIGADADNKILQRFIGHEEIKPLLASNAEDLVNYMKWVSTVVLKSASSPASQVSGMGQVGTANVIIPTAPPAPSTARKVW